MPQNKLRIYNTDIDNLASNLRGEVLDIIFTWTLLKTYRNVQASLVADNKGPILSNKDIMLTSLTCDKFQDELIARLAELATCKIGRLTFYFAQQKLTQLRLGQLQGVEEYIQFIKTNNFIKKRNFDISHKELPLEKYVISEIDIPYKIILKAVALAVRLMKQIDRIVLGPMAPYMWRDTNKHRYNRPCPGKVSTICLKYMRPRLSAMDHRRMQRIENQSNT
ncbi:hypothetical protein KA005_60495 [bacterium]|nr:hypothetical protein [bacterium]